jgi:outer membrane immunogenic protein
VCAFWRSFLVLFSLVGALTAVVPARAGNIEESSPGVSIDWSGLYVGLHGGYGWSRQDTGLGSDIHLDGWLAGGHLGLQRQFDRWVVGIEASYTGGDLDGSKTIAGLADIKATVSDILMITGRLGYTWRDRLFYVKAGYASADVDLKITTLGGTFSSDWRADGWTAGIGFERHLTSNVTFGLEYNYIDLGSKNFTFSGGGGPVILAAAVKDPYCPPDKPTSGRLDPDGLHTVLARLSFKFGGEPDHIPYK